jgi:uncharacterized zinc-type alcohol dehydrogenase-like protein
VRTVTAYAAPAAKAPFEKTTIERRDLDATDVLIEIAFVGVCHSDIHAARDEWGASLFPIVPGHEITGVVTEIGAEVSKFEIGDRVGVGCMVDSCRQCTNCLAGEEQYCARGMTGTYGSVGRDGNPTRGGYSTHIVVEQEFVLNIPAGIELDVAAPLLCAGITTYSPLNYWQAGPDKRVGVIGLGGLGHMAVKFAHAMGAHVTVLSQSLSKRDNALAFAADDYYATGDEDTFNLLDRSLDLVINTVSGTMPMAKYLSTLGLNGVLVNVGAPPDPIEVPAFALIGGRRSWAGSIIGGIRETQQMLNFCAEHDIAATIERIGADQIDDAFNRVVSSEVRYRFVIDASTFR